MSDADATDLIELTRWTGPWPDDDRDANFKAEVALYAHVDPLRTVRGLSAATGIPVGAVVRFVLARWASEGASGLLELGPTMTRRLDEVCRVAELEGTDEARLAAFSQLRQMISWLAFPLEHPEVYEYASDRVERARSIGSVGEARDLYERWAVSYDHDVYERLGFTGPDHVADRLLAVFGDRAAGSVVLDVGCGTGVVGERLAQRGVATLDGLDLSPAMLRVAGHKGVYRRLIEADLTEPLAIPSATYDAVVSAGTFVSGHVRADALRELVRITRPGGVLVVTVMETFWEPGGFAEVIPALVAGSDVELLDERSIAVTAEGTSTVRLLSFRRAPVSA